MIVEFNPIIQDAFQTLSSVTYKGICLFNVIINAINTIELDINKNFFLMIIALLGKRVCIRYFRFLFSIQKLRLLDYNNLKEYYLTI